MSFRVHAGGRVLRHSISPPRPSVSRFTTRQLRNCTVQPVSHCHSTPRAYCHKPYTPSATQKQSGSGYTAALIVLGIAVGGALFYPRGVDAPTKQINENEPAPAFSFADRTDSFLVMAPNTPPGRPGTLTPEQEGKLRELWAATMKVFGALDEDVNGAENASQVAPSEVSEKDGKKDKKKSRLNVFRRNKGDKGGESEPASGTSTPDISKMALSDDDKHGQNKEFKDAIANTAPEDLRKAFWSMVKLDHPDALLLRFLRARKWDVEKALIMMISTMHWRLTEMHVDDDIMKNGEEVALKQSKSDDAKVKKEGEDFLTQLRMGKCYLHGTDSEGRPMCIVRARLHHAGEQSEASLERCTVYTIETARLLLRPPIDTATIVFDLTDFSLANMDYAPVKFMIKCFEANYPESLGTVLVYKAPWIFNTIWNVVKGWLDPVVAGKVHFAKNVDELQKFVPKNQIPKELGGDDPYEYKYPEPVEGENAKMDDAPKATLETERQELVSKYEKTIFEWIAESETTKSLEERRKERDTAAEGLRDNYWKLDPYVRARSLYDRIGLIGEGGKLQFYPAKGTENAKPAAETSAEDLD